jgi:hypothetical protein
LIPGNKSGFDFTYVSVPVLTLRQEGDRNSKPRNLYNNENDDVRLLNNSSKSKIKKRDLSK